MPRWEKLKDELGALDQLIAEDTSQLAEMASEEKKELSAKLASHEERLWKLEFSR